MTVQDHHPVGFSKLGMASLCPASIVEGTRGTTRTGGKGASQGTALHRALETDDESELSDFGKRLLDTYRETVGEKIQAIGRKVTGTEREVRKTIQYGGEELTFGWLDELYHFAGGYLVADLKGHPTGYLPPTATRWQLMAGCVAVLQNDANAKGAIGVAIAPAGPTVYEVRVKQTEVPGLVTEIKGIVDGAMSADPAYNPGYEQCRYCPGLATCRAASKVMERVSTEDAQTGVIMTPDEMYSISNQDAFSALVNHAMVAKRAAESCLAWCKDVLSQAESTVYELAGSGQTRKIRDPEKALGQMGHELAEAVKQRVAGKWRVSDLEAALRETRGLTGKALKDAVEDILGDNLTLSTRAPSIQKRKEVVG